MCAAFLDPGPRHSFNDHQNSQSGVFKNNLSSAADFLTKWDSMYSTSRKYLSENVPAAGIVFPLSKCGPGHFKHRGHREKCVCTYDSDVLLLDYAFRIFVPAKRGTKEFEEVAGYTKR